MPIVRIQYDYCSRQCQHAKTNNTSRAKQREEAVPNFIGVDGEGMMVDGKHRYVLLSVGDQSYHRNGAHLDFLEIMDFLYSCYKPGEVYVGYYLGYDFTQWLRTLPMERAAMLLSLEGQAKRVRQKSGGNPTPFPVRYKEWEFDLLAGRRWKLRPQKGGDWMYVCDVGGYFQMSFVRASNPADWHDLSGPLQIATKQELEIITRGKARRATAVLDAEMIEYNQAENRVLGRMMDIMAGGLCSIGVRLNKQQWIGPGAAVQAWMKDHNSHTREAVAAVTPLECMQAARDSFFGGWFEITHHGHVPGISYEYDLISAYPNIHSQLPCLLHGKWRSGSDEKIPVTGFTCVRASVFGSNRFLGTMLHRTPKGRVMRPINTYGAFWLHELQAAQRAGLIDEIHIHEWHHYQPCKCTPPMYDLRNLFLKRIEVGKTTPSGKSYKLIYNSAYGKTAQSVGTPMFANPIHASLITCGTRTMILDAIATHPKKAAAVVMIATDGVYFNSPHPSLDIGTQLGQWESSEKRNLTLVMPGVYWDDKVRTTRQAAKIKSRGVNAQSLLDMIDTFDNAFSSFTPWQDPWPKISTHMNFAMVTAKQALQRNDWSQCGLVHTDYIKTLSSDPSSKRAQPRRAVVSPVNIRSQPYRLQQEHMTSAPYRGSFGLELQELKDNHISDDGLTMDASMAGILNDF